MGFSENTRGGRADPVFRASLFKREKSHRLITLPRRMLEALMPNNLSINLARVVLIVCLIAVWQMASSFHLVSHLVLPSPFAVAGALAEHTWNGDLPRAWLETSISWFVGLSISLVIGGILGLAIGSNRWALESTRFVVDFLRSVPAVTLIPLALLLYGASLKMKLTIIVFGCTWDMLVQALYAARQVDPVALDTLRAFNLSRYNAFRTLHLPSALPFLSTGVRLAAIHALLLSIGVELVGGVPGLGQELFLAGQQVNGMPTMYAYVGVAGISGVLLTEALTALDKKLLYGHPGYRS